MFIIYIYICLSYKSIPFNIRQNPAFFYLQNGRIWQPRRRDLYIDQICHLPGYCCLSASWGTNEESFVHQSSVVLKDSKRGPQSDPRMSRGVSLLDGQWGKFQHRRKESKLRWDEWHNLIAVTIFLLIMNQTKFRCVHNQKENSRYDHISINLKVVRNLFGA